MAGKMIFRIGVVPGVMSISQEQYAQNHESIFGVKAWTVEPGEYIEWTGKTYRRTEYDELRFVELDTGECIDIPRLATVKRIKNEN